MANCCHGLEAQAIGLRRELGMASVTEGGRRGDSGCHRQRHSQRRGKGSLGWEGQRLLGTLVGAMALELTGEHRCNCAGRGGSPKYLMVFRSLIVKKREEERLAFRKDLNSKKIVLSFWSECLRILCVCERCSRKKLSGCGKVEDEGGGATGYGGAQRMVTAEALKEAEEGPGRRVDSL